MISFDEAVARLAGAVRPLPPESVALEHAHGRTLAEDLHARIAAPRTDVSIMDGYAVRLSEAQERRWLSCTAEARPGTPAGKRLEQGEARRIFTGAPIPEGADCIIMQECAEREGAMVRFTEGFGPSRHIRPVGSDFEKGDVLLPSGTRLAPRALLAAAAGDHAQLRATRRPAVSIIATGDELVAPGSAAENAHGLPDSISPGLAAMAVEAGAEVVSIARGKDDLPALSALAQAALEQADCIVVTGGASVGAHDHARAMFGENLELVFSKVAIKPGKPVWLGRHGTTPVLGLPGNPTSAIVTARLFLRPLLAALQGRDPLAELLFQPMPCASAVPATGPRETFLRAKAGSEGLTLLDNTFSGAQHPLAAADWLIRRSAGSDALDDGAQVAALLF